MYNGGGDDNNWYDPNYQSQMKKDHEHRKLAGVGAFLSEASQSGQATVQVQNYEKAISTKDYSRPFYCKVCHIDCGSEIPLQSHLEGKSHAKKLRQLGLEERVDSKIAVKPSTRMPKFVFLAHKIQANPNEPVIGLHQIEEFLTETNTTANEPRYTCNLCSKIGLEVEPAWSHLIGSKHRQNYMEMALSMKVERNTIHQLAIEVEIEEGRDVKKISRTVSDSKYPWPNGKVLNPQKAKKSKKEQKEPKISPSPTPPPPPPPPATPLLSGPALSITDPSSSVKHLLGALVKGAVKTEHDAELAFNVCQCLIAKLGEYRAKNSSDSSKTMKEWDAVFDSLIRVDFATKFGRKRSHSPTNEPIPSTSKSARKETPSSSSKEWHHHKDQANDQKQQRHPNQVNDQQQQRHPDHQSHQKYNQNFNGPQPHQRKRPNQERTWQGQNYQDYGNHQQHSVPNRHPPPPPPINHPKGPGLHPNLFRPSPKRPPTGPLPSLLSLNVTNPKGK